jgi:beta-lactam-binding protein with PASTA domain
LRYRLTIAGPPVGEALRHLVVPLAWIVGGAALVLIVFGLSFYLSIQAAMRSNEVTVPDLSGLDLERSSEMVKPMELKLQVVDQRHDPAVSSGKVLEQMPRAGSSVRRGRKVKLVLSLGGEVLDVPDLIGRAARPVEIELRQEGFVPGDEARVKASGTGAGTVIGQVPPPDTPAVPNTRVHRLVSDGPPLAAWVMPDLTGLTRADAERWISRSGFRRGTVRRVRMIGWPAETVVGQLPLAGYAIRKRDIVELTLAR